MRAREREYNHADGGARVRSSGVHRAAEHATSARACGHVHEREHMRGHRHAHAHVHAHTQHAHECDSTRPSAHARRSARVAGRARAHLRAASAQRARGCRCARPSVSGMNITLQLQSSAMHRKLVKEESTSRGREAIRARPARARARGASGHADPAAARRSSSPVAAAACAPASCTAACSSRSRR